MGVCLRSRPDGVLRDVVHVQLRNDLFDNKILLKIRHAYYIIFVTQKRRVSTFLEFTHYLEVVFNIPKPRCMELVELRLLGRASVCYMVKVSSGS